VLADFEAIYKLTTTTCTFQGLAGLHKHLPPRTLEYFVLLRHEVSS